MCCIEEASSGQVPKQTFSVIVAFIGCLDLSRFICSINNFMCPLIISPLFLKANARAQLTTISISWGRISLIHESPSSRSDQFYSRAIPDFCQVVKDVLVMFFPAFTALATNNSYRIFASAVPFRSLLPSLSGNEDSTDQGIHRLYQP